MHTHGYFNFGLLGPLTMGVVMVQYLLSLHQELRFGCISQYEISFLKTGKACHPEGNKIKRRPGLGPFWQFKVWPTLMEGSPAVFSGYFRTFDSNSSEGGNVPFFFSLSFCLVATKNIGYDFPRDIYYWAFTGNKRSNNIIIYVFLSRVITVVFESWVYPDGEATFKVVILVIVTCAFQIQATFTSSL